MPRYIVKPDPSAEFYVEWSTVVDNIVGYGDATLFRDMDKGQERKERTDKNGTSVLWETPGHPLEGGWDDKTFIVSNTERRDPDVYSYTLNRSDLMAYALAYLRDDVAAAEALLVPNREQ